MIEKINDYLNYFYETVTLEFVFKFFIVYFFIIWIALIVWVMKDISIRTNNLFFQVFCILILLIGTPLGVFIYLLVRPRKTLYERYYDEIDVNLDIIAEIVEERKKSIQKTGKNIAKSDVLKKIDHKEKKTGKNKKSQIQVKKF